MFSITEKNINTDAILKSIEDRSVGGIVLFEGRVRNHNEGKDVLSLDYEIYPEMAISEGQKIVDEAKEKFDIVGIECIHRYGNLELGDIAVLVVASSKHRKEAFLACEFVIDKVKEEVPVWKKEHYTNAQAKWVACHRCMKHEHTGDHQHG